MFWLLYGKASPSRFRRNAVHAALAGFALVAYGFWVDFAPSAAWYNAGPVLAGVLTLVVFGIGAAAQARGHQFLAPELSASRKWLGALVLASLLFWVARQGIVFGVGALATQLAGQTVTVDVPASTEYSRRRRACDYRLRPQLASPEIVEICLTAEEYGQLPRKMTVTLLGSKSVLGLHIAGWEPASVAAAKGKPLADTVPQR